MTVLRSPTSKRARASAPSGSICYPVATHPPESPRTIDEACNRWKGTTRTYFGRGERIRTSDILLPKQTRYQAAPRPVFLCRRSLHDGWTGAARISRSRQARRQSQVR